MHATRVRNFVKVNTSGTPTPWEEKRKRHDHVSLLRKLPLGFGALWRVVGGRVTGASCFAFTVGWTARGAEEAVGLSCCSRKGESAVGQFELWR